MRLRRPHLDPREPRLLDVLRPRQRQNVATFGIQRAWRTPGTYLYRLTRTPLDTRRLPNGVYRLVVTATDIRGNSGSLEQVFIVRNGPST